MKWGGAGWWKVKSINLLYLVPFKGLSSEFFGIQTFVDGFGIILSAVADILKYLHTHTHTHTCLIDFNTCRMKWGRESSESVMMEERGWDDRGKGVGGWCN